MIKSLANRNYLNFSKMIIDNYLVLELSEDEAIVILKIYNKIQNKNTISICDLATELGFSKTKLNSLLQDLIKREFLKINYHKLKGVIYEDFIIDGTYNKFEKLYAHEFDKKQIKDLIEKTFQKPLTSSELYMVNNFNYTYDQVKSGLKICLDKNIYDLKYLTKVLENG